jgi:protein KRI1
LTPLDILTATDTQLNEFVGLKKLGPYRSHEVKMRDKKKYGKKKRLREWRKKIEQEGEDEEVKAMLRSDPQKPPKYLPNQGATKKKKQKHRKEKPTVGA